MERSGEEDSMARKLGASFSACCSPTAETAEGTATAAEVWPPSPSPRRQAKSRAFHPGPGAIHSPMLMEQRSTGGELGPGSCRKGKFRLKHASEKQHGSTSPGFADFQFQRHGLPLTFTVKLGPSHHTSPWCCWEAREKPQFPARNQTHNSK